MVRDSAADWSWVGFVQQGTGVRYLYLPYGPTARDGLEAAIESAVGAARSLGLDFLRFEPCGSAASEAALARARARRVKPVQPQHTWVLDLDADEEALRAGLERGHRSRVNAAPRKGVEVRVSEDPHADVGRFLELMRRTTERAGFVAHPDDYYRAMVRVLASSGAARLYVAEKDGRAVSAAISFEHPRAGTRYYAHAAADQEVNRKVGASVALVWRMILDARASGYRLFDFWGVAPEGEPDHPWASISHFKRSFGGRPVDRLGTWEIPLNLIKYTLYRAARQVARQ